MMTWLRQVWRWLKRVWSWLWEGRVVIGGIGAVALAVWLSIFVWKTAFAIRLAGFGLQIGGTGLAIYGIISLRTHLEQVPYRVLFVDWIKRFPRWKQGVSIVVPSAETSMRAGKVRVSVWAPDRPQDAVDVRIERIVQNVESLRDAQHVQEDRLDRLCDDVDKNQEAMIAGRNALEEKFTKELEESHTRDILISLVGLVWLMAGITASTFALELAYRL